MKTLLQAVANLIALAFIVLAIIGVIMFLFLPRTMM